MESGSACATDHSAISLEKNKWANSGIIFITCDSIIGRKCGESEVQNNLWAWPKFGFCKSIFLWCFFLHFQHFQVIYLLNAIALVVGLGRWDICRFFWTASLSHKGRTFVWGMARTFVNEGKSSPGTVLLNGQWVVRMCTTAPRKTWNPKTSSSRRASILLFLICSHCIQAMSRFA